MPKPLPSKKTKIVCTVGPASASQEVLVNLIAGGMNIARVNFAHGDFDRHRQMIATIRAAAEAVGERVAIMGDLPGPKIRVGEIPDGPVELEQGQSLVLTNADVAGDQHRVSHSFPQLPHVVKPGDNIYLNDGYIQLQVERREGDDVVCKVIVGGPLSSRKGMNLPGIDLGICAFTDEDHQFLKFAAEEKLDAVSQSFVETARDVEEVRRAGEGLGYYPMIIAKIERAGALQHLDEILRATDGIMVARGDLGVEIPIEQVTTVQKQLIAKANRLGKPVITATHMLESMIGNRRPTRAEATDVANAILDGTDCLMLSGETAVGRYPVDAVNTMARIAQVTERSARDSAVVKALEAEHLAGEISFADRLSLNIDYLVGTMRPAVVFVPTKTGATARRLARFRLPVWIVAFSRSETACQQMLFSYGVYPIYVPTRVEDWSTTARLWSLQHDLGGTLAILTEGFGTLDQGGTQRIDILDLHPAPPPP